MTTSPDQTAAGLTLWPAATCLITELANELARLPGNDLGSLHVVLPTKRLVPWLHAMLARTRPAFIPPRTYTLDDFVRSHAAAMQIGPTVPAVGDLGQELLLAALLKEASYKHLLPGHEHEIKQFLAELTDWQLPLEQIDYLAGEVKRSSFLSEGGIDTLGERFAELRALADKFYNATATWLGAMPEERHLAAQSQALAATWSEHAPPWQRLYIVGVTSAQSMHAPLLSTLARRADVHFWMSAPPQLSGTHNPIELLIKMLEADDPASLPRSSVVPATDQATTARWLQVVKCDSLMSEVAEALQLAEAATGQGLAPSSIALLVTNDAIYGKPLRALLKDSKLKPNLALGTPLAQTEIGTWLIALFDVLDGRPNSAQLLALLAHPLTLAWAAAGDGSLALELTTALTSVEKPPTLADLRELLPPASRAVALELTQRLGPLLGGSTAPNQVISQWTEQLSWVLRDVMAASDHSTLAADGDVSLTISAVTAIEDFLSQMATAAAGLPTRFSQREFLGLIRDRLLALDVRSVGDPLSGLQVLSVAEARYVPFDLVIVLGCSEGDFPRALPRDHLVDHYLKTKIGLPGWHLLEAIEDTTFHLLRSRLPAMVLMYPESRGSDTVVRSRFIETAVALGEATEIEGHADLGRIAPATSDTLAQRDTHHTARTGLRGATSKALAAQLITKQSATSLEYLLACPYRFLAYKLGIRRAELPERREHRHEGDWLHKVLEGFFSGRCADETVLPPLREILKTASVASDETLQMFLGRLSFLTTKLMPAEQHESPLALHLSRHAWPAFACHVQRLFVDIPLQSLEESSLQDADGSPITVEVGGIAVELRGVIDSVIRWGDWHLITDYKRRGAPDRGAMTRAESPQLLLYAWALATAHGELPLTQAVTGYWSILNGAWTEGLAGHRAIPAAKASGLITSRTPEDLGAAVQNLEEQWTLRHQEVLANGNFSPDARRCGYCELSGVCRRDDPALTLTRGDLINPQPDATEGD
ncbi:MAG: hypothetical protein FJ146_10960 [Deltaproteobacteria bacterium]|nr:hypothetical protein [Deltaproteobacteria bacterium]